MRHDLKLGFMLMLVAASLLRADPAPPAPADAAEMKKQIALLADDDAETRQAARIALMGVKRANLLLLRDAIKESLPLVTSQTVVLRDIVTHIYIAGETYIGEDAGFLGVRLSGMRFGALEDPLAAITRGAPVAARIPGFCAFRMLHDGDVILAIEKSDSQPRVEINSADDLIASVKPIPPGRTITLEVLRRGRIIRVPLTLDRKPMGLEGVGAIDEFTNLRLDRAEAMWKKEFLPLLEEAA